MGWPFFAENPRRRKKREIDLFAKLPFSRVFARFFGHPSRKPFFLDSGLLSCGNAAVEVDTTRNATKQGVSEPLRVSVPLRSLLAFRKSFILRTCLEDNFFRMLLFCTVPCSKFCRNWVSKLKKPLGLQNWARFEKRIFRSVSAARANLARGGCAAVPFFFVDFGSLSKMALPLRCGGFFRLFRFFFRARFRKPQVVLLTSPSFFWVFFSFVRILLGIGGNAALHVCFWAVGLRPFYFLGVFGVFLDKHCFFPLKKGYLGSFLSVSLLCLPFVLLGVFHFSLSHSLSLSLSLSISLSFIFLVFFCPCCLLFIFTFLVFWLFFLVLLLRFFFFFMRRTTSKYYIWKLYFHNLCLFIFLFRLSNMFLSLLFHYLSCLCWWTSMFFNFSKKTISKTPILVLHIVKGYRFL